MAGVDFVLQKYPLDPSRKALMAIGYGGETGRLSRGQDGPIQGHCQAAAPGIDQFSEYGTERGSW